MSTLDSTAYNIVTNDCNMYRFFHTAFQDDLTQFPMKRKTQAAAEVTTQWQADIAEGLVWL